jgi:hypothetical protein
VKSLLMTVVVTVSLCLIGLALAMTTWTALPVVVMAAVGTGGVVFAWRMESWLRERRVRALIVAAYAADAPHTRPGDVVRVLGTPDVVQARSDYLRREDLRMAQMYANGEISDF